MEAQSKPQRPELAAELETEARPRPANVAPEVGRALVEVEQTQRALIEAQREIMNLRSELQLLKQQRAAYIRIIGELRKRAKP